MGTGSCIDRRPMLFYGVDRRPVFGGLSGLEKPVTARENDIAQFTWQERANREYR